jgi:hypothetical protein
VLLLLGAAALAITFAHMHYYTATRGERVRAAVHPLLKPSAGLGFDAALAALALFVFLWLYPLRKSWRVLDRSGALSEWLDLHVIAGLVLPVLVGLHAGWRFEGFVGLAALAIAIVCLSGVVGRYLYVHIPRRRGGLEQTREEVVQERRALLAEIALLTGHSPARLERSFAVDPRPYPARGVVNAFVRLVQDDLFRIATLHQIEKEWSSPDDPASKLDRRTRARAIATARREMALDQQLRALEMTRRIFGLWHIAHRPFALTALIGVTLHVVLAIVLASTPLLGGH